MPRWSGGRSGPRLSGCRRGSPPGGGRAPPPRGRGPPPPPGAPPPGGPRGGGTRRDRNTPPGPGQAPLGTEDHMVLSIAELTQDLHWQEPPPRPLDPGGPETAAAGLLGLLQEAAARRPAAIALQDERLALSYGNLLGSAGALAGRIAAAVP